MGQILFAPAGAGVTSDDVTATKAQVLSGYTALTKDSNDDPISGTMTNRGAWTSSSSGSGKITIPAGYHNGSGYVDCSGAYNKGVTDADNRTNTNSANYKAGYNAGYTNGRNSAHLVTYKALQDGESIYTILEVDGQQKYKGNSANTNFTTYIWNTSINIQSRYVNSSIIAHLYINGTEVFNDNLPNIYHYGRSLIVYV